MEYKVFRVNEFDWVIARSEDDAVEWYEKTFGEKVDRNEVKECDIEKEGQYVEFEDTEKIEELNARGTEEVRVPDENGMNGFGSLVKRDREWYIKVPFKEVLPIEETEPYVTATTEW